tara:strand:+ start:298 stop:651 length:354 start_codon:yes stop_codon:yes gene_type:complete
MSGHSNNADPVAPGRCCDDCNITKVIPARIQTLQTDKEEDMYEMKDAEVRIRKDTIVESVVGKFQQRSDVGIKKYNQTLDREDLSMEDWAIHLQEELMDATLYIEKLLTLIRKHGKI